MALIDLTGQTFDRLTVLKREGTTAYRQPLWRVRCTCGQERVVLGSNLRSGNTRSCGCLRTEILRRPVTRGVPRYKAAHQRVVAQRGAPSEHPCTDCVEQAQEWSYEGGAAVECVEIRNGKVRRWSPDPLAYVPRCIRCHRAKDLGEAVRARRARRAA